MLLGLVLAGVCLAPSVAAQPALATEQQRRAVDAVGLVEVPRGQLNRVRVRNASQGTSTSGLFSRLGATVGPTCKDGYLSPDGELPAVGDTLRIQQNRRAATAASGRIFRLRTIVSAGPAPNGAR